MNATRINLNDLILDEKKALVKKTYQQRSYFETLFNTDQLERDCPSAKSLRNEIERLLLEKNVIKEEVQLEQLHTVLSDEMKAYNFNDGVNKVSTFFYETGESFKKSYYQFIVSLRENFLQEPFWFQETPTIRIHCPNGANSHHYPRYHSDISYGHPPEEINIWLPLTQVLTGHHFKIFSLEQSRETIAKFDHDFAEFINQAIHNKEFSDHCTSMSRAVDTDFGKMLAFDPRCIHSGEPVKSHTRVSMDIRILPLSQYEKMTIQYQGSGRRKILFEPGHCYHENHSDYFLENKEFKQ